MKKYVYFLGIPVVLLFVNLPARGQNVPKPLQSAFLIETGIGLHDEELYDSARFYFQQITRNDSLYGTACYEIALGYYVEKEYDSALVYVRKAVNAQEAGTAELARTLIGTIFYDADMRDSAIIYFQTALKITPYNHKLWYDFGAAYYDMDSLDLAEKCLIQAITLNPAYYKANFMLGRLNEKKNRRIEAMLCYYMANLLKPNADLTSLVELYLAGESDIVPLVKEYTPTCPSFEKIEEYIDAKIAMTAKYKPVFKSSMAYARQGDILFKYLEYDPKIDNFYMNYPVRMLTRIRDKKQVETAMYIYYSGFNSDKVQKWILSNKSKIQKFYSLTIGDELTQLSARGLVNDANYQGINYVYENGNLVAFGKYSDEKNKIREGLWHFLNRVGSVISTENYTNGKLDGEEKNFNSNGQLLTIIPHINGMASGKAKAYHDNGNLKTEATFENDKLQGTLVNYFLTGQKHSEENYKNDTKNGLTIEYYKNGAIADSLFWNNGKENGTYCAFYPNNQLKIKGQIVNDLIEGELVYYYSDGQISGQGNYVKGNQTGKAVSYHPNGAISSIGFYNDKGNLTDTAKYFNANGVLTSFNIYSNNGKNIQKIFLRPDGSIFAKEEVKNENLVKMESFDNEGKLLETTNVGSAGVYVKTRNWLGNISSEGMLKNGKNEGKWIYYGFFGNVERISYFKNDEKNGTDTTFYSNGKIKSVESFKDDKSDGYGFACNLAGKITIEGYCVDNEKEGYWLFYDNAGNITQKAYYTSDEPDQWQVYYYPNGNLLQELYYNNFLIREIISYDTLGIAHETLTIPDSACKIVQHYPNGQIRSEKNYIGGVLNGELTYYHANGQKSYSGNEILNKTYGTVISYDEDGKIRSKWEYIDDKAYGTGIAIYNNEERSEGKLFNGETYDTLKWYNSENKLTETIPYMEDEKHGWASYYADNGELAYQLLFYRGTAIECISPKDNQRIKIENNQKIITYFANGVKSAEMIFLNGYREGEQIQYYPNGKLFKKSIYEAGYDNGYYTEYYSNGNLKQEGNYIYGDEDGIVKQYHPNGKLKEESFYVLGKKHGEQKSFNQQGVLEKKRVYYYGEMQE